MPEYLAPGVYVEEVSSGVRTIEGASTSTGAFVGVAERGPVNRATLITNLTEFYAIFGRPIDIRQRYYLAYAVEGFFREGGTRCYVVRVAHYADILDRGSLTGEIVTGSFDNESGAPSLTVSAASEGAWGRELEITIRNSSRFGTSLATGLAAGSVDRISVASADGVVRGAQLWIVRPVFASVAYAGTNPQLTFDEARGLFRDPAGTRLVAGASIAAGSLLLTPDFRYMARLSQPVTLTGGADHRALHFVSPTAGWAVGAGGAVVATADGGATWTTQASGVAADLHGVHFASATAGWAVGAGGAIVATADGGATWTAQTSGVAADLRGVHFADATHGWAVGAGGAIVATADGGNTWRRQANGTTRTLTAVRAVSATTGWAAGAGGLLLATTDGGTGWTPQAPRPLSSILTNLTVGRSRPNEDLNGEELKQGETLWIVEPAHQQLAIVDRVEGNTVVFGAPVTLAQPFPASSKILARDFELRVGRGDDLLEAFAHLSPVEANQEDFAPNRINLGGAASRQIRVDATDSALPMRNVAPTRLSGVATDPDGLENLNPFDYVGNPASGTGFSALDDIDDASILVVPYPRFNDSALATDQALRQVYNAATQYCEQRRYMVCVLDSGPNSNAVETLTFRQSLNASNYAAYYWPWIWITPAGQSKRYPAPPSGAIAGIYAYADQRRGVHKAPAGTETGRLKSATGIERIVSKAEQDGLNNQGVNVIRSFPGAGLTVWGARTISSNPEWRYVNVRRLMNFIQKSIDDGTQWVVFEPNNLALWKKIERDIGAFLRGVWRGGALFGETEDRAFRVRCDAETNPSETIELGQVITEIRVAVVKPAEFVIFRIKQFAAGSDLTE
jgi:phage tail sheath protein FI